MYITKKNKEDDFIGLFAGHDIPKKKEMLIKLIEITFNSLHHDCESRKNEILNSASIQGITDINDNKVIIMKFGQWIGLWDDNYNLTNLAKLIKNNEYDDKYIQKYFDRIVLNLIMKVRDNSNNILVYNPLILFLEYCINPENNVDKNNKIDSKFILESFTSSGLNKSNFNVSKKTTSKKDKEKVIHFLHLLKNTSYFDDVSNNTNNIAIKFNNSTNISDLLSKCNKRFHNKPFKDYENYLQYSLTKLAIYLGTKLSWHQKIYYGAPGTGKSHNLKEDSENYFYRENIRRITFHPSYSYSNFIGVYKPRKQGENQTVFNFLPGPLINILIEAYEKPKENHLLIIEEINRSNVSEVFGDFFQSIERDQEGKSQYAISANEDLKNYLNEKKQELNLENLEINDLRFPSNLYIWATMNSSDQGTFPLDTAFKRRWHFEYVGIDDNEKEVKDIYFKLPGDDEKINWNKFRKFINTKLLEIHSTINEDKLLGPFFIGGTLNKDDFQGNAEIIKNKVIPYLYEDILKFLGSEEIKKIFNEKLKTLSQIIKEFGKENAKFADVFSFSNKEIEDNANNSNSNNNATTESQNS